MRSRDRAENMDRYPTLYYPEIYVLKGGYKQFYAGHKVSRTWSSVFYFVYIYIIKSLSSSPFFTKIRTAANPSSTSRWRIRSTLRI